MKTRVLQVDPQRPAESAIAEASEVITAGGLVAFPTETVYGLGANALSEAAVAKIFEAKGRPPRNPIIVHVADEQGAQDLVAAWPESAQRLAQQFWPGPLTLVLPKQSAVPDNVTAGGTTVGVRVPSHPVALQLLKTCTLPIAAPSANRSSRVSPTRAEHVLASLEGRIELILDAGPTPGGIESTVVDLSAEPPRILRPGLINRREIEAVLEQPNVAPTATQAQGEVLKSPGQLSRHYAPSAKVELVAAPGRGRVAELAAEQSVGWLSFGPVEPVGGALLQVMPTDAAAYSADLYAALYAMDAADVDVIVVDLPPERQEWEAVHDRLRRAAKSQ